MMLGSVEPAGVGWHYGRKHNRGSREVGTTSRREGSAIPGLETTWFAPGLMEGRKLEKEPYTCPRSTPPSSSNAP